MKLKGKLIMSAAALAACAATLTSTTYAWYTSNTQVDASGITGTSASTGDANVLISTDHTNWSQSVDLSESLRQYYTNNTFQTVSPENAKTDFYKAMSQTIVPAQATVDGDEIVYKGLDTTAAFSENGVMTITLYVKTTATGGEDKIPLYLKTISITNTATTLPTADNLLNGKNTTEENGGVDNTKASYSADITKALWMSYTSTSNDDANKTDIFDLSAADSTPLTDVNLTNPNALTYLNKVQETNYTKGKTKDGATNVSLAAERKLGGTGNTNITVANLDPTGEYTTLTFTFFLNGWDEYCFDACKGQTFNVSLAFTTEANTIDAVAKYTM